MAKYEDRFDKLDGKLDTLNAKLDDIVIIQTKQQVILEEHMARTKQVEDALVPLKAQQNQLVGASKLVALIGMLASIAVALFKIKG